MKLEDVPFYDEFKHLDLILLSHFGSKLYGTNSDKSDVDLVGIYMPTEKEMLTGKFKEHYTFKSKPNPKEGEKNTCEDTDIQIFSLHYFLNLAIKGETIAMDLLHTTDEMTIYSNYVWSNLQLNRSKFYSKNMVSLVGYARSQAAKYGVKGNRLKEINEVLKFIDELKIVSHEPSWDSELYKKNLKLQIIWDQLPTGEHIHFMEPDIDDKNQYRLYQVCGVKFPETCSLEYMRKALQKKADEYGERARKAESNEGVDWKAISHAIRAAFQVIEIMEKGKITYPLAISAYIKQVKYGHRNIKDVQVDLEGMIDLAERRSASSDYPEKINVDFWDDWLYHIVKLDLVKKQLFTS